MFELVIPPKQIVEHIRHVVTDSRASKFEVNSHEVPQDLCGNHEANPTRPTPEILLIMTQCRQGERLKIISWRRYLESEVYTYEGT